MTDRIQYLFTQFYQGTCSEDEFHEFFQLLKDAESEAELRDCIDEIAKRMNIQHPSTIEIDTGGNLNWPQQRTSRPIIRFIRRKNTVRVAAVIAVVGFSMFLYTYFAEKTLHPQILVEHSVDKSRSQEVILPDSSAIVLNQASKLTYPKHFDRTQRVVNLEGEAFFDIRHAEHTPFIIHAGKVKIEVLGTAFNVKMLEQTVNVSVARGKVRVSMDDQTIYLIKGQEATFDSHQNKVEEITAIPHPEHIGAWKKGSYYYYDKPLKEVIYDLGQYYDVKFQAAQKDILNESVHTSWHKNEDIDQIIGRLALLLEVDFVKHGNAYIINRKQLNK